jgi:hypothetical protein
MGPPVPAAVRACGFAGVDPTTIAYTHSDLTNEEREHFHNVAAQTWAVVLATRTRYVRASNNDVMDVLGRAFSSVYGHVIAETSARCIRDMTD